MALNDTPLSSQSLNVTQNPIRQNFITIDSAFSVDHESYGSANVGKHKQTTFPVLSAGPTTLANEMAVYTKNVSGVPQLFLRRQNSGAEIDFSSATSATTGETTLPSGIKLKWGIGSTAGTGLATIVFANAFTTIFTVQASISTTNDTSATTFDYDIRSYLYTNTQFQVVAYRVDTARNRVSTAFVWFAIGV